MCGAGQCPGTRASGGESLPTVIKLENVISVGLHLGAFVTCHLPLQVRRHPLSVPRRVETPSLPERLTLFTYSRLIGCVLKAPLSGRFKDLFFVGIYCSSDLNFYTFRTILEFFPP